MENEEDINELFKGLSELFKLKENYSSPNGSIGPLTFGYQCPIRGSFINSGDFSPGVATDKNHAHGHDGVDLSASAGTSIYPLTAGVVTNVSSSGKGGNTVNIEHANGVRSYYAHCGTVNVRRGERVTNNTVIATVGDSGNAKGTFPHLHFQVWENGTIQNPAKYFSIPPFKKVDEKKMPFWLSEKAKEEAQRFSMQEHVRSKKAAFSQDVEKLHNIATSYFLLISKS